MTRAIGLNFHGIGEPKRVLESGEGPYWVSPEQFEYMLDQVAASPDPSRFVITFDDASHSRQLCDTMPNSVHPFVCNGSETPE